MTIDYEGNKRMVECVDCGNSILIIDGNTWDSEGIYIESVDGYICDICREEYYYCNECDELFHIEDLTEVNDNFYCRDHIPTYDFTIRNGYRESPDIKFYGTHPQGRYYGIELEIDDGDDYRNMLIDINNLVGETVFFQYDGSLSRSGVEIISQPCTLNYHIDSLGWDEIMDKALAYDYLSHDTSTCGLHIHVSKDSFGSNRDTIDLNIAKMVIIFERFWDKIVTFSRRDYERIQTWAKKPSYKFNKDDSENDIKDKSKFSYDDRYSCINLNNYDTVEFRVFRGTLKYNTLIASLQFIDVLMDYVMDATLEDVFEDSFLKMLSGNKYQELTSYLNERGMI